MTYSCKYKNNPSFPYNKPKTFDKDKKKDSFTNETESFDPPFLSSLLSTIENIFGRKIAFDDILLLLVIYVIFTEKNKENNTLLLCLLFILLT